MGGPASKTTTEIYMQAHERTATSTGLHPPKVWERLLMTFIPLLTVHKWKNVSITTIIFIKILSLLWRRKIMQN